MEKTHNKSTTNSNPSITGKSSLFFGGIVVLILAATPFIFYSYKSFPDDSQIWETSLFTLKTGFPSWYAYAWYMVGKVVPLYLLLLWFFTCKHWWHWIILVPIAMYAFQLWGLINESGGYDELEIYLVLPLMMVVIPIVYLVRAKLFAKVRGKDLESFEAELMERKSIWGQIKDLFR